MPNTRVNDVKVHHVDSATFTGDLLAATQEPCFLVRGDGGSLQNKGGVVLYDVTDPANPTLLKKAYIAGHTGTATNFGATNFWEVYPTVRRRGVRPRVGPQQRARDPQARRPGVGSRRLEPTRATRRSRLGEA